MQLAQEDILSIIRQSHNHWGHPTCFKGKMESPHPPLYVNQENYFKKVKAWGKAFQLVWDMHISQLGLWILTIIRSRLVT
jgi:hypothetical protein